MKWVIRDHVEYTYKESMRMIEKYNLREYEKKKKKKA